MNLVGYSIMHPMFPMRTHNVISALMGRLGWMWRMQPYVLVVFSL